MATSISDSEFCDKDDELLYQASQQYEEEAERHKEDDFLYQASQQYEEEAERHLVERYQHMQDEDFGLGRLMEEESVHETEHLSRSFYYLEPSLAE